VYPMFIVTFAFFYKKKSYKRPVINYVITTHVIPTEYFLIMLDQDCTILGHAKITLLL